MPGSRTLVAWHQITSAACISFWHHRNVFDLISEYKWHTGDVELKINLFISLWKYFILLKSILTLISSPIISFFHLFFWSVLLDSMHSASWRQKSKYSISIQKFRMIYQASLEYQNLVSLRCILDNSSGHMELSELGIHFENMIRNFLRMQACSSNSSPDSQCIYQSTGKPSHLSKVTQYELESLTLKFAPDCLPPNY